MGRSISFYSELPKSTIEFIRQLHSELGSNEHYKNIIWSPLSILYCLATIRLGAESETAAELDKGLGSDYGIIAQSFQRLLKYYENSNLLKIANATYVMKGLNIQQSFNELISKNFRSEIESIDFSQSIAAASTINDWVQSKTNNLINNVVSASDLDCQTRMIVVNAIHFKGIWEHTFPRYATNYEDFYLNETTKVKVPMMSQNTKFMYAEIPELQATALEMPYKNSDLSMLIILPDARTGLKAMEQKLKRITLTEILEKMSLVEVNLNFPRFKTEFSAELTGALAKLGISRMFSSQAEFGKVFENSEQINVSKIVHKAFIEVNEDGTEAAAVTGIMTDCCYFNVKSFNANRPFYYSIVAQRSTPIFEGTFCEPDTTQNNV